MSVGGRRGCCLEGVEEKDVWKISRNLIAYPRISKYERRTCYSSGEMYLPISPNISRYTHISDDTRLIKVRGKCTDKYTYAPIAPRISCDPTAPYVSDISPYLPISGRISPYMIAPYLPTFPHIPPYLTRIYCWRCEIHLPTSQNISAYVAISQGTIHNVARATHTQISPYITLSPHVCTSLTRSSWLRRDTCLTTTHTPTAPRVFPYPTPTC